MLKVSSKNLSIFIGTFSFIVFSSALLNARPTGLNNEGCEGSRQEQALLELKERLPSRDPLLIGQKLCRTNRCDGGFVWLPYMINVDRSWVVYTLPKKGNWVAITLRNICTHRSVLRADFLNEDDSPYIEKDSAYALGWALDEQQELYNGYNNMAVQLSRPDGDFQVGIYGLDGQKLQSRLLDSFTVSPL